MGKLPTSCEDDLRYYVHAGVRPGVALDKQDDEARLWICDKFLRHSKPFPKYIVHGHTPTIYADPVQLTPDIRANRCNVDTGAGSAAPSQRQSSSTDKQSPYTPLAFEGFVMLSNDRRE